MSIKQLIRETLHTEDFWIGFIALIIVIVLGEMGILKGIIP